MDNEAQKLDETIEKIETAFNRFIEEVELAQKEHKEKINKIIEGIRERKIKEIQDKIKAL